MFFTTIDATVIVFVEASDDDAVVDIVTINECKRRLPIF
jgi:hypothetical protein